MFEDGGDGGGVGDLADEAAGALAGGAAQHVIEEDPANEHRPGDAAAGDEAPWLEDLADDIALPGLRYLRNGHTRLLPGGVVVAGLGGCHGPSDYDRPGASLRGYARRHYTRDEVDQTAALSGVDVLLLHDAPEGIEFVGRYPSGAERRYRSQAVGLAQVVSRLRPSVCFFGHHHRRVDAEIGGVRCIGLNLVGRPGNLVAFELERGGAARIVGEWPDEPLE